jgi:hypothetical protein
MALLAAVFPQAIDALVKLHPKTPQSLPEFSGEK